MELALIRWRSAFFGVILARLATTAALAELRLEGYVQEPQVHVVEDAHVEVRWNVGPSARVWCYVPTADDTAEPSSAADVISRSGGTDDEAAVVLPTTSTAAGSSAATSTATSTAAGEATSTAAGEATSTAAGDKATTTTSTEAAASGTTTTLSTNAMPHTGGLGNLFGMLVKDMDCAQLSEDACDESESCSWVNVTGGAEGCTIFGANYADLVVMSASEKVLWHRAACQASPEAQCEANTDCVVSDAGVCELDGLRGLELYGGKDLRKKGDDCKTVFEAALCTGLCTWSTSMKACGVTFEHAAAEIGLGNSQASMQSLAVKASECAALKSMDECNANSTQCQWRNLTDVTDLSGICELSRAGAMGAMAAVPGTGSTMAALAEVTMICSSKPQMHCRGSCEWKEAKQECAVTMKAAWRAMAGQRPEEAGGRQQGEAKDVMSLLERTEACQKIEEEESCKQIKDCKWSDVWEACELHPVVALSYMGADGNRSGEALASIWNKVAHCHSFTTEDDCGSVGDCVWDDTEGECELDAATAWTAIQDMSLQEEGRHSVTPPLFLRATACRSIQKETQCKGDPDCSWSNGKCEIDLVAILQAAGQNVSASDIVTKQQMVCSQRTKTTCGNDKSCEWSRTDGVCQVSYLFATTVLGGLSSAAGPQEDRTRFDALLEKAKECSNKTESECIGTCFWDAADKECEVNPILAISLLPNSSRTAGGASKRGDVGDLAMSAYAARAAECMEKAEGNCTGACVWKQDGEDDSEGRCQLSMIAVFAAIAGTPINASVAELAAGNKDLAALLNGSQLCLSMTAEECSNAGDCSYDDEKQVCVPTPDLPAKIRQALTGGSTAPGLSQAGVDAMAALDCVLRNESTCSPRGSLSKCEWNNETQLCQNSAMNALLRLGQHNSSRSGGDADDDDVAQAGKSLQELTVSCHNKTEAECDGSCRWVPAKDICEPDGAAALDVLRSEFDKFKKVFGDVSNDTNSTGTTLENMTDEAATEIVSRSSNRHDVIEETHRRLAGSAAATYRVGAFADTLAPPCPWDPAGAPRGTFDKNRDSCVEEISSGNRPEAPEQLVFRLAWPTGVRDFKAFCAAKDLRDMNNPECSSTFSASSQGCLGSSKDKDPVRMASSGQDFVVISLSGASPDPAPKPPGHTMFLAVMLIVVVVLALGLVYSAKQRQGSAGRGATLMGATESRGEEAIQLYSSPNNYAPPSAPSWSNLPGGPERERLMR